MTDLIPSKRFAVSLTIPDDVLENYKDNLDILKDLAKLSLITKAQSILPQYPGHHITDEHYEADRDNQNQWNTITLSFRLEKV